MADAPGLPRGIGWRRFAGLSRPASMSSDAPVRAAVTRPVLQIGGASVSAGDGRPALPGWALCPIAIAPRSGAGLRRPGRCAHPSSLLRTAAGLPTLLVAGISARRRQERIPLKAGCGGRYWIRTSDLADVNRAL